MSKSGAYYNEFDPKAAAWLRELIKQGHIADGEVDGRSIVDVSPDELRGFTQCHFFAGIGVWSYALRSAGWADDRQVWTGSCPCQPFSAAGRGAGVADERHLWPHWHHLISQCQPAIVFGEQVASKDGLGWLDLVHADLEATGYAVGAADMCAAGLGAPHIRQRLWFVGERLEHAAGDGRKQRRPEPIGRGIAGGRSGGGLGHPGRPAGQRDAGTLSGTQAGEHGEGQPVDGDQPVGPEHAGTGVGGLADAIGEHLRGEPAVGDGAAGPAKGQAWQWERGGPDNGYRSAVVGLADANGEQRDEGLQSRPGGSPERVGRDQQPDGMGNADDQGSQEYGRFGDLHLRKPDGADQGGQHLDAGMDGGKSRQPSPTDGFWRDADWLFCRDGKWRPVEPGTFPLAHGASDSLANVLSICKVASDRVEEYADRSQANPSEIMRMVRKHLYEEAGGEEQPIGVRSKLYAPEVLLNFMLSQAAACDRAADSGSVKKTGKETVAGAMHIMRMDGGFVHSSHQRRSDGQQHIQFTNTLHELSFLLACDAQAFGEAVFDAHAAINRVGMLRGYGNAIAAPVAQAFIESVMEITQ